MIGTTVRIGDRCTICGTPTSEIKSLLKHAIECRKKQREAAAK